MRETWVRSCVRKIPWRRKLHPTPVFMPGKSHGPRSLVGYNPWGRKESDTTERLVCVCVCVCVCVFLIVCQILPIDNPLVNFLCLWICLLWTFYVSRIILYMIILWLILSLSIKFSRFIHVVICVCALFLYMAE